MKKNIIRNVIIGISIIAAVLIKNYYSLHKRIKEDRSPLEVFSTDDIELLLPKNKITQTDTTYLEDDSVLAVSHGIGGTIELTQQATLYGISIVEYTKNLTNPNSFHIDSIQANLINTLNNTEDFKLNEIKKIKFKDLPAVMYEGKSGNSLVKAVVFNVGNKVFSIHMNGLNTSSKTYQNILESVKLKQY